MNKKILTITGIVFALIFVVILSVMMSTITTKGNDANTQLVDTLEMTSNANLDLYEHGASVKGEQVINAIKNVRNLGGDVKMVITVKTKANSTDGAKYGYTEDGNGDIVSYNVTDSSDKNYINASAQFKCERNENGNGVVTGLTFTQE